MFLIIGRLINKVNKIINLIEVIKGFKLDIIWRGINFCTKRRINRIL